MYGLLTYIWLKCMVNVGKCTIHGSYGICFTKQSVRFVSMLLPSMKCILSMDWNPPEADRLVIVLCLSIWAIYLSNPSPDCFKAIFGIPGIPQNFSADRHWGDYSAGNVLINCSDLWYIPTFPGLWTSQEFIRPSFLEGWTNLYYAKVRSGSSKSPCLRGQDF